MPDAASLTFDDIAEGREASFETDVTDELVQRFAELSGDRNPLHMDAVYAASTRFGERIAHGFAVASFFSTLVGMHLPGTHALYLSQTTNFRSPIRIGTRVVVRGVVTRKTAAARTITIATMISDAASGTLLIDGTALVQVFA